MKSLPISIITKHQVKTFTKDIIFLGTPRKMIVSLRYDDSCGNGHNSFGITADIVELKNSNYIKCCRCLHTEIKEHFPELEYLIEYHGMSSDSPLHYITNTIYHASNKDCWGRTKGEPYNFKRDLKVGDSPFTYRPEKNLLKYIEQHGLDRDWDEKIIEVPHKKDPHMYSPNYTFEGLLVNEWHEAPFKDITEAKKVLEALQHPNIKIVEYPTSWGKGKEPDLEAARRCAIWPDATLEQLQNEELLKARLPELVNRFKLAMESVGFTY